jgi:hypothetical protein
MLRGYGFIWPAVALCSLASGVWGQIPVATDRPKPLPPEQSRRQFVLPEDLQIELVAAEPLIVEPTDMAFDEKGRLFVCESPWPMTLTRLCVSRWRFP